MGVARAHTNKHNINKHTHALQWHRGKLDFAQGKRKILSAHALGNADIEIVLE